MIRAIEDYKIVGLHTTMEFAKFVMEHPAFISGDFDTHFVNKHFKPEYLDQEVDEKAEGIAAIVAAQLLTEQKLKNKVSDNQNQAQKSNWKLNRL